MEFTCIDHSGRHCHRDVHLHQADAVIRFGTRWRLGRLQTQRSKGIIMRILEIVAALILALIVFVVAKVIGLVVHVALIAAVIGLIAGFVIARMFRRD